MSRLNRLRKRWIILSFRAKRGISLRFKRTKRKRDSSLRSEGQKAWGPSSATCSVCGFCSSAVAGRKFKIRRQDRVLLGCRFWCIRQLKNHLSGACEAHFFPRDALDGFGIGLQRVDLLGQRFVLVIYLADLLADLFNFFLRTAHGDEAVRAEN